MNRDEAKTILSAYRPDRDDARDPAFAEAFAWLDRDDTLADWFVKNNAMDQEMRMAFATIQPPEDLKEAILAASKIAPISPSPAFWQRRTFALAAGFIFLIGFSALWFSSHERGTPLAKILAQVPQLTAAHQHPFGTGDGDINKVRQWLGANGGIANFNVPRGLQDTRGVGCEVTSISETKVSILCFDLPGRGPAHLYVMERSQLSNPPPTGHPELREEGQFATASWSDGNQSYILAMRGDESSIRALL